MRSFIDIQNRDCIEAMKETRDDFYDLAIVDPPYGIGISSNSFRQKHARESWDDSIPGPEYFEQLFRVSKNQVIWGGNYFDLPPSQGFIIWDKVQPFNFSSAQAELAWISYQRPAKIYKKHVVTAEKNKIHPTQKPVTLYSWILRHYAKEGDKILDTHLGSGSIALACWDLGFDLDAFEINPVYYENAVKRLEQHKKQLILF